MRRPRVFFEERDDPLISGIGWVSELIEIAGGIDVFTDRRQQGQRQEQPNGSAGESMPYRDIPVSGESSRSLRPVRDVRKPSSGDLPPARERWFESIFLQRRVRKPSVRARRVSVPDIPGAKPTSSECAISSSRLKSHLEANRRRPKDDGAHRFLDHGSLGVPG